MSAVAPAHTGGTTGARRIAEGFAKARAEGRAALIPYVVAGYPDADTSLEIACAAIDAGADLLEVGLPYSDPLADGATLQRASQAALAAGATFDASLALLGRIARARPGVPLVPMGYANQLVGGGDGRERARALASAGACRRDRGRPDARRGRPVRGRRGRRGDRRRLPRRPDHVPRASGLGRGAERRVPVLRLARGRDGRADGPPVDRQPARPRRPGRVAGPGRGGLRRLDAGARPGDRQGRARTA